MIREDSQLTRDQPANQLQSLWPLNNTPKATGAFSHISINCWADDGGTGSDEEDGTDYMLLHHNNDDLFLGKDPEMERVRSLPKSASW